jgi:hypothetical protein
LRMPISVEDPASTSKILLDVMCKSRITRV